MILATPGGLGFEKFSHWRKHQDEAILKLNDSEVRFSGLVAPTGSGKSLTYMAYSKLSQARRVCILTSTKTLQDQLSGDFKMLDVRGQQNYPCMRVLQYPDDDMDCMVDEAKCHIGYHCKMRDNWVQREDGGMRLIPGSGCAYYDAVKEAKTAPVVLTNYSFWLASNVFGGGLGVFDLLVLDEAHAAPDDLAGFLSFSISESDAWKYLQKPLPSEANWWSWCVDVIDYLNHVISFPPVKLGDKDQARWLRRVKSLSGSIAQILAIGEKNWVAERTDNKLRIDISNPAPFAEQYLFRETNRVVLSSATVRRKTLDLLGVEKDDSEMLEFPSTFAVDRRPIYVMGGAPRMNHQTAGTDILIWQRMIDSIIDGRRDRRGVIHTVSFKRAKEIIEHSRHADIMITHKSGSEALQEAVRKYLSRKPAILVTPSATTGLDLPGDQCEYIIIPKIPYPDMRSKVLRARMKADPDYPAYLAAQVMVQSSGRGMRSEMDRQETFIVDGNWRWFMSKYSEFTPKWWRAAVRRVDTVPRPPGRLM